MADSELERRHHARVTITIPRDLYALVLQVRKVAPWLLNVSEVASEALRLRLVAIKGEVDGRMAAQSAAEKRAARRVKGGKRGR